MDRAGTAVRPLSGGIDTRQPDRIGRTARLELRFAVRGGRGALVHQYAEPPLRVGRCLDRESDLHLVLASSAPGVFAGDDIHQHIIVERGARVLLTSQSALQLHPGLTTEPARVTTDIEVEEGASVACLLEPMIPFAGAALEQRIRLAVAPGGCLIWSDGLMCGREGRGERWAFAALDHELRLECGGAPAYLERFCLLPGESGGGSWWSGARHAYFGTLAAVGLGDAAATAEALHSCLVGEPAVDGAADLVEEDVVVARIAARDGAPFHRARRLLHELVMRQRRI